MDGEERFATRGAAVSLLFLESEENKRTESIISESEDTDGEYSFREKVKDDEESTEWPTRRSRSIKRPREDIFSLVSRSFHQKPSSLAIHRESQRL
jgi:hypothetical protein